MRHVRFLVLPLVLASCAAPGGGRPSLQSTAEALLPVIEAFGDAAVRVHLTAAMIERAPELLSVLDVSGSETGGPDGAVSLDELRQADWSSPVVATVLLLTLQRLVHF